MAKNGPMGTVKLREAGEAKLQRQKSKKLINESRLEDQVIKHLSLRGPALQLPTQLNRKFFDSHTRDMSDAATVRYIRRCVTVLRVCFGVPRKDLIAYSKGGTNFSHDIIIKSYRGLLDRIKNKKVQVPDAAMDIVSALMKDRDPYREGTMSKFMKETVEKRKSRYQKIIEKCKIKAAELKEKQSKQRSSRRKKLNLIGRYVLIPGDFYETSGVWYKGIVTGRKKYREDGVNKIGWRVTFPPSQVSYGDIVTIRRGGKWIKGEVVNVRLDGGKALFDVRYSGELDVDGSEIVETEVPMSRIKGSLKMVHETWGQTDLMKYIISGNFTAADIDSGRIIDRLDNVFMCEVGDHVYVDWKNTGEWFYGDIVSLNIVDGDRLYDIIYDDGDVERGVNRERIQFLDRPPMTKELQHRIDCFVDMNNDDSQEDRSVVGSVIDLTRTGHIISDPEKGEITGHTDTC